MRRCIATLGLTAALFCGGCSGDPTLSETGYTGTWVQKSSRVVSLIAITKSDGGYRFRCNKLWTDDDFRVRCDWDGRCEEWFRGRKQADYLFTTRTDELSGRLLVECHETRLVPEKREHHYIDELSVEAGGRILRSYTIERNGVAYESGKGPQRSYTKVSDSIADPPPRPRS
jgi:hypothetical protein